MRMISGIFISGIFFAHFLCANANTNANTSSSSTSSTNTNSTNSNSNSNSNADAQAQAQVTVKIIESIGEVQIQTGAEKSKTLSSKLKAFDTSTHIETKDGAKLTLQFESARFVILPNSAIKLYFPDKDNASIGMEILSGTLRTTSKGPLATTVKITSAVTSEDLMRCDCFYKWDPASGIFEFGVFSGQATFGPWNAKERVIVNEGEMYQFLVEKENGKILYDILLRGKKNPRATMSGPEAITPEKKEKITAEVAIKAAAEKLQKKVDAAKAKFKRANFICAKPNAKYNQCSWSCEGLGSTSKRLQKQQKCPVQLTGVRCVRRRCNAQGQWDDEQTLLNSEALLRCKTHVTVDTCDY